MPQLLKPACLEPVLHKRSPLTTMKSSHHSSQLEKARAQQQRPNAAKKPTNQPNKQTKTTTKKQTQNLPASHTSTATSLGQPGATSISLLNSAPASEQASLPSPLPLQSPHLGQRETQVRARLSSAQSLPWLLSHAEKSPSPHRDHETPLSQHLELVSHWFPLFPFILRTN